MATGGTLAKNCFRFMRWIPVHTLVIPSARFLEQQMLHRLRQQTYVGGRRVDIPKLPRLPVSLARRVRKRAARLSSRAAT